MADPYNSTFNMGYFPCDSILMLTMQQILCTFSSLVLLAMVQEVLMTLEQTDLLPLHMRQTRTQITPSLVNLYCKVLSATWLLY
jgi:hypothetical protein